MLVKSGRFHASCDFVTIHYSIRSVDVYSEVVECSERVLTSYRTYRIRTVLYRITTAGRVMFIKLSTARNDVFIE